MRHPFLFLLIIIFLPGISWGQSFSAESRVDSLGENYYKLSYSFSDTVLAYDEEVLDYGLPFPFFMTTPEDKFTVDSAWVNDGRTEFEIFLNTVDSIRYTFISNNVLSKDSLYLDEVLLTNFYSSYTNKKDFQLAGTYSKVWLIIKSSQNGFVLSGDGSAAFLSTILIVLDMDAKSSIDYQQLDSAISQDAYFHNNNVIERLMGDYAKNVVSLGSWVEQNPAFYIAGNQTEKHYYENRTTPGVDEELDFNVSVSASDSVILLFTDIAYLKSEDYKSVVLHRIHEDDNFHNVNMDIEGISLINPINTSVNELNNNVIQTQTLSTHPNPFNPSTQVSYTLPEAGDVSISVFNILGQRVAQLSEGFRSSGAHTTTFNAAGLSAGMYLLQLESVGASGEVVTQTKKVTLVK